MKKVSWALIIVLAASLSWNAYLLNAKQRAEGDLLRTEVHNLKMFTQNAIAGLREKDTGLLRQTYSNFQSSPPFGDLEQDSSTERVIHKYEELYRFALNDTGGRDGALLGKLEQSFDILVPLSEDGDLSENEVRAAMAEIDQLLDDLNQ